MRLIVLIAVATLITAIPYDLQQRSLLNKGIKSVNDKSEGSRSAPDSRSEAESSAGPDQSTKKETSADICVICLGDLDKGGAAKQIASCPHRFHADCIDQWNQIKPTCPLCMRVDPVIESSIAQQVTLEAERRLANSHEGHLRILETLVQRHEEWISRAGYPYYQSTPWEPLETPQDRLTRLESLVARHENWLTIIGCASRHLVQPPEFRYDEWTARLYYLGQLTGHHQRWYHYDSRSN